LRPVLPSWLIEAEIGLGGFFAGVGVTLLLGGFRRKSRSPAQNAAGAQGLDVASSNAPPGSTSAFGPQSPSGRADATGSVSPHLSSLIACAIREPLRRLRRTEGCPPEALHQLERIAWQTRMMGSGLRPMQSKSVSPISLLQQAAEEVPLLRDGVVGASWSLLNRQPIQVDPERARLAFREIMTASAETCREGGRLAVRVLPGNENGYPTQIEVEIGQPGAEADPLAFLVAKHLLESQGGRVEIDGRLTRVHLRGSSAEAASVQAQTPSKM
jgi:hypothetical protein